MEAIISDCTDGLLGHHSKMLLYKKKKSPQKLTWSAKSSKKEAKEKFKLNTIGSLQWSESINVVLPPHKQGEKESAVVSLIQMILSYILYH